MTDKILRLAPSSEPDQNSISKNSIVFDSYVYNLTVKATPCGLDVAYTRELSEKERNSFPEMFRAVAPREQILLAEHIHPKWWWKFIFRTTESELKRFIKETKKAADEFQKHKNVVTELGL